MPKIVLDSILILYALYRGMTFMGPQTDTVTVPIREANELSYEYDGRWDARYSKCGCLDGVSILGMNTNDGQDIRTLGNGHHVLISHIPLYST